MKVRLIITWDLYDKPRKRIKMVYVKSQVKLKRWLFYRNHFIGMANMIKMCDITKTKIRRVKQVREAKHK